MPLVHPPPSSSHQYHRTTNIIMSSFATGSHIGNSSNGYPPPAGGLGGGSSPTSLPHTTDDGPTSGRLPMIPSPTHRPAMPSPPASGGGGDAQQQGVTGLRPLESSSGSSALPGPLERAIAKAHTTVQVQSRTTPQGSGNNGNGTTMTAAARLDAEAQDRAARAAAAMGVGPGASPNRQARMQLRDEGIVPQVTMSSAVGHKGSSLAPWPSDRPIVTHNARQPKSSTKVSPAKKAPKAATSASSKSSKQSSSNPKYKKRTKKYNNFNIFFMLERQLLLQSRGGGIDAIATPVDTSDSPLTHHGDKELHLPPLCRRYDHLPLTSNWFLELLASQNKKRPHRKSHGLIPFKELAQTVAKNYREIDDETQGFVNEVAERLGWHCEEIERMAEQERKVKEEEVARMHPKLAHGGDENVGYAEGKKSKAPVVSVARNEQRTGTNDEEAALLLGMKSHSPDENNNGSPRHHQVGMRQFPGGMRQFLDGHSNNFSARPSNVPSYPTPQGVHSAFLPSHSHGADPMSDFESERLQLELNRAMHARLESERRIHLLQSAMCNRARNAAAGGGGGGRHPSGPVPQAALSSHAAMANASSRGGYPTSNSQMKSSSLHGGYEKYLSMLASGDRSAERAAAERSMADRALAGRAALAERVMAERGMAERAMAERSASRNAASDWAAEGTTSGRSTANQAATSHADARDAAADAMAVEMAAANRAVLERARGEKRARMGGLALPSEEEVRRRVQARDGGESPRHTSDDIERALVKEAMLRGLLQQTSPAPGSASAARPGSASVPTSRETLSLEALEAMGYGRPISAGYKDEPLKKRARYSEGDAKTANDTKEEASDERRPSSEEPAPSNQPYHDPYARLAASRHAAAAGRDSQDPQDRLNALLAHRAAREEAARDPVAAAIAARDLAFMDSLLAGRSGSGDRERALLDSLAATRGRGGHPSSGYPPELAAMASRYPSGATFAAHGGLPSYASLLAQLGNRHHHPASAAAAHRPLTATPPSITASSSREAAAAIDLTRGASDASPNAPKSQPKLLEMVHAATRKSQFNLSYNDIMDVWKEMNRAGAARSSSPIDVDAEEQGRAKTKEGETEE